ncbi:MAG: glycosyltransferase family 2 protein [Maribacter sp.]|nr:glycosyltransferase family 2 protein [Maribacter sp.]
MMVSVCMAVYNGERFIKEQIDSILPQLQPQDELIISDDGSVDDTLAIITAIKDKRIRVFNSNSHNIVQNFENALNKANGDIIFLSDQDDIWHPSKVEECLNYLHNNILVFSNLDVFSDDLSDTIKFYDSNRPKTGILRNIIKNHYIGATMAFKKKVLDKALPFPKGIYMHDIWLALVAEVMGSTFFIEKPLIYYRRHENNASQTGETSSNPFLKKIGMRIVLTYNLIRRFL